MARPMCGARLSDRNMAKNVMLMFGLKKTIDQLAMASSVY